MFDFLDGSGWEFKLGLLGQRWVALGLSSDEELLGDSIGELKVGILALFVHQVDSDEEHAF